MSNSSGDVCIPTGILLGLTLLNKICIAWFAVCLPNA